MVRILEDGFKFPPTQPLSHGNSLKELIQQNLRTFTNVHVLENWKTFQWVCRNQNSNTEGEHLIIENFLGIIQLVCKHHSIRNKSQKHKHQFIIYILMQ